MNALPFPHEPRCAVCRLAHLDKEAHDHVTEMLCEGHPRRAVLAYLRKRGLKADEKSLSRHYRRHMLPWWREALYAEARIRAVMEETAGESPATIASAGARSVVMGLMETIQTINYELLAKDADAKLIAAIARACKGVAEIDRLAAQTRLAEKMLDLRKLEFEEKALADRARLLALLTRELKGHPDALRAVKSALTVGASASRRTPETKLKTLTDAHPRP